MTSRRIVSPGRYQQRFYELDLINKTAREISFPSQSESLAVATDQQGLQLILVRARGRIVLMARDDGQWGDIEIPEKLARSQAEFFHITSDAGNLLILAERVLWHRLDGEWRRLTFSKSGGPEEFPDIRDHLALIGNTLYIGFNRGEWGGAVVTLDLGPTIWTPTTANTDFRVGLPVHGFKRGPAGDLWVVEGLAHRSYREGSLRILRKNNWLHFAKTSGRLFESEDNLANTDTINWNFPDTDFIDLDFDNDGNPYILTPKLGILRHHNGDWQQVTKHWPDFSYHDSALGGIVTNDPNAMAIVDEHTAVLTVNDTGVLVYDLDSGEISRIPIPK